MVFALLPIFEFDRRVPAPGSHVPGQTSEQTRPDARPLQVSSTLSVKRIRPPFERKILSPFNRRQRRRRQVGRLPLHRRQSGEQRRGRRLRSVRLPEEDSAGASRSGRDAGPVQVRVRHAGRVAPVRLVLVPRLRTVQPTQDQVHAQCRHENQRISEGIRGKRLPTLSSSLCYLTYDINRNACVFCVGSQQICRMTPRFSIGDCAGGHRADNREKNRDVLIVPRKSLFSVSSFSN